MTQRNRRAITQFQLWDKKEEGQFLDRRIIRVPIHREADKPAKSTQSPQAIRTVLPLHAERR